MVVLMEEFGGLSLKRKGADEPELFDGGCDDRSVFPLSCRPTKMRRLACPDGQQDRPEVSGGAGAGTAGQVDLPMGDASAPSPAASAAAEEEKAMVLFGGGQSAPQLRSCDAQVRAGADWVVRAMLREADSRTVRELLAGAQEQGGDLALAVVPWVPPSTSPVDKAEPSVAEDAVDARDSDGAAAMEVEEDEGQVHHWTTRRMTLGGAGAGWGEGFVYRWPQHCMAPPQLSVVGQASPVMWSW